MTEAFTDSVPPEELAAIQKLHFDLNYYWGVRLNELREVFGVKAYKMLAAAGVGAHVQTSALYLATLNPEEAQAEKKRARSIVASDITRDVNFLRLMNFREIAQMPPPKAPAKRTGRGKAGEAT